MSESIFNNTQRLTRTQKESGDKKWFKDQHRQIKIKLTNAQESGNDFLIEELLREKENLLMEEKELN